jgi:hypothetical protein
VVATGVSVGFDDALFASPACAGPGRPSVRVLEGSREQRGRVLVHEQQVQDRPGVSRREDDIHRPPDEPAGRGEPRARTGQRRHRQRADAELTAGAARARRLGRRGADCADAAVGFVAVVMSRRLLPKGRIRPAVRQSRSTPGPSQCSKRHRCRRGPARRGADEGAFAPLPRRVSRRPSRTVNLGRRASATGTGWASDGRYVDPAPRSGRP